MEIIPHRSGLFRGGIPLVKYLRVERATPIEKKKNTAAAVRSKISLKPICACCV